MKTKVTSTRITRRSQRGRAAAGFTLLELMVVLAIIVIILGVALTNQNDFNRVLVVKNTAYDVALSLKNAQAFGLGSRTLSTSPGTGFGIHFEKTAAGVPDDTYVLFADTYPTPQSGTCHKLPPQGASAPSAKPGDCVYEANKGEKIQTYTLGNGVTIKDICVDNQGTWQCEKDGVTSLDIVFARPNPDVFISAGFGSLASYNNGKYESACLVLSSRDGKGDAYVSVGAAGDIAANTLNQTCPP